jgi:hypothetical protein
MQRRVFLQCSGTALAAALPLAACRPPVSDQRERREPRAGARGPHRLAGGGGRGGGARPHMPAIAL